MKAARAKAQGCLPTSVLETVPLSVQRRECFVNIARDSPDEPRTDVDGRCFLNWLAARLPRRAEEYIEVLNREINASLARPEIKAKYDDLGLRINAGSPADFGKLIADETERWGKVIRAANIKLQ